MKHQDSGLIVSIRSYGEKDAIIKIFCRQTGLCRGFVRHGQSQKNRSILQIGNFISFDYSSRTEESLWNLSRIDLIDSFCGKIIFEKARLSCAQSLLTIIDEFFLEREPFLDLFDELYKFFGELADFSQNLKDLIASYIKLELAILQDLGYAVDLSSCAATGSNENLSYVSPKSARAVSYESGKVYANRMLVLPQFLIKQEAKPSPEDLINGMKLSEYFIQKFLFPFEENIFLQKNFWHRMAILDCIRLM